MNVAELLAPIAPDQPAGSDVRYGAAHSAIRSEVQKGESPSGDKTDWGVVLTEGNKLLQHDSKDLLVACYVAVAALETHAGEGLAEGLEVIHGLLQKYWDDFYPPKNRVRARVEALRWLVEQLERRAEQPCWVSDGASRGRCVEILLAIQSSVGSRFEEGAPSFGRVLASLKTETAEPLQGTPPTPQDGGTPAPAEDEGAVRTAPSLASPSNDAVVLPQTEGTPTKILAVTGRHLISLAAQLRKVVPEHPAPYRLLRVGVDVPLHSAPEVNEGRTCLQAPPKDLCKQLETLEQNEKWVALLEESEGAIVQWRCWLSPHRSSAVALCGLGRREAASAVEDGAASLLRRLPELQDMLFSDGTPFADEATIPWLNDLLRRGARSTSHGRVPSPTEPARVPARTHGQHDDSEAEVLGSATSVCGPSIGDDAGGTGPQSETSGHAQFKVRLALAAEWEEAGAFDVARPLYEGLAKEASLRGLSTWDPTLCSGVLSGYLRCLSAPTSPEDASLKRELECELASIAPQRWVATMRT